MREERQAQALPFLRQAHQLQPTHPDATRALADAEFHAGTAGDALPLWREVVAARPGDVNARLRLGETLNRLVLLDEEIANYEDALSLLPESARSEEHTSELQSLMRISYAVFCLKKKH